MTPFDRKSLIVLLAVLGALLGNAAAALAEPPPAFEGRRLFVSYCQLCHGKMGKGDGPLPWSVTSVCCPINAAAIFMVNETLRILRYTHMVR
jgi:hypothetical protein